jgi:hypothetical protein
MEQGYILKTLNGVSHFYVSSNNYIVTIVIFNCDVYLGEDPAGGDRDDRMHCPGRNRRV